MYDIVKSLEVAYIVYDQSSKLLRRRLNKKKGKIEKYQHQSNTVNDSLTFNSFARFRVQFLFSSFYLRFSHLYF